jgi:hypothetical protein
MEETITIRVKTNFPRPADAPLLPYIEITAERDWAVSVLKYLIEDAFNLPAEQQRLVYKGKVLLDDQTLVEIGMQANDIVHLVKKLETIQAASTPVTLSSGAGDQVGLMQGLNHFGIMSQVSSLMDSLPEMPAMDSQMPSEFNSPMMREMRRNPQMIEMMTRMMGNPDIMNAMIESNPQLKQFLDSQPGSREMLWNPAVLQQSISMMQRLAHAPVPGDQASGFAAPGSATAPAQACLLLLAHLSRVQPLQLLNSLSLCPASNSRVRSSAAADERHGLHKRPSEPAGSSSDRRER